MILKGSQRGGAGALARHLLRMDENEHVTLREVRGFVAEDVHGALAEAEAIAKGTKCKQHLFSLSLNPPRDGQALPEDLIAAADEAEKRLGLAGCHRIIVEHEKNGRRHAHAVWSRIDPSTLKSVNMAFFKTRLAELSRDLTCSTAGSYRKAIRRKARQTRSTSNCRKVRPPSGLASIRRRLRACFRKRGSSPRT